MSRFPPIEAHAGNESLWIEQARPFGGGRDHRHASSSVDVAIVGGGLTGLWTAYTLAKLEPALRIAVHEARHVGFGASGRNGGWAVGLLSHQDAVLASCATPALARQTAETIAGSVDAIADTIAEEGIDCGFAKGGMLRIAARDRRQHDAFDEMLEAHLAESLDPGGTALLGAEAATERLAVSAASKAFHWPHCAALNPAQLTIGLAEAAARRGVEILENSPVARVDDHRIETATGVVTARHVLGATEGYSDGVAGLDGRIIPVYSLVLATRPLSDAEWGSIGLRNRETFSDCSALATYGQRSADDRLVFGAFGLYPISKRVGASAAHFRGDFQLLERVLVELLPQTRGVAITHRWTGTLGVSRRMQPALGRRPASGLALAGGYLGRGVAAANIFGRLAALTILGRSANVPLPSPQGLEDAFPRWEGELLRYLGAACSLNPERWAESVRLSRAPRPVKSAAAWVARSIPVQMG